MAEAAGGADSLGAVPSAEAPLPSGSGGGGAGGAAAETCVVTFEAEGPLGINFAWPAVESIEPGSLAAATALQPGMTLAAVQVRSTAPLPRPRPAAFGCLSPPCCVLFPLAARGAPQVRSTAHSSAKLEPKPARESSA